ncbi:MAG: hypothetical protein NZV14_10950 [Bryobacteraceae bacterium]|nr:hypothetical protein [Bryobacteraceae bacterium]MDW8378671.1 hypothetical protein [Bryobacterales bacterium]
MIFSLQFETLTLRDLSGLGNPQPPAVTVLVPGSSQGSVAKPIASRLKFAVDQVTYSLDQLALPHRDLAILTTPILSLSHEPALRENRRRGLAIFVDRQGFHFFDAPGEVVETVVVSNHFYVKPLLAALLEPRQFFILELGPAKVRLIEADGENMRERPLPRTVPESLDQISSPEFEDHTRISRYHRSRNREKAQVISFGLTSANEQRRMQFFCTLLDRGLSSFLQERGLPLVLAGGDRIVEAYHRVNSYHETVDGALHGDIDYLSHDEIIERARMLIKTDLTRRGLETLAEFQQSAPGDRWTDQIDEVVAAAAQGRVWKLFLAEGAHSEGDCSSVIPTSERKLLPIPEDLVNAAAAEAIASGADIYVLPPALLPAPAVAIYRYSLM